MDVMNKGRINPAVLRGFTRFMAWKTDETVWAIHESPNANEPPNVVGAIHELPIHELPLHEIPYILGTPIQVSDIDRCGQKSSI